MVARDVILKAENIMKKMIFSMLSKENIWNLLSFPDGVDEEKSIERIKYFANSNELTIFISMCADVLSLFSEKDCDSIGQQKQTEVAEKFIGLFEHIEKLGFYGPKLYQKNINFWSGLEAKKMALGQKDELSDNKILSITLMFALCNAIKQSQGEYTHFNTVLSSAISKVYALHARGVVNIYISSEKKIRKSRANSAQSFLAERTAYASVTISKRSCIKYSDK